MVIYKFKNEAVFAWFVIGMFFVALPVGYFLEQKGVELSTTDLFALAAGGGLVGELALFGIQRLVAWRKFLKLSKYRDELEKELQIEASKKYPIKHLEKNLKEFEEQFAKRINYELILREPFEKKISEKFHLTKAEYQYFLGESMMGFSRHDNMMRGKDY